MDIMTHLDSMTLNTRRLIRCMVDTVHEPLVVLDSDRMILNASAAFCELFRLPRERVVGQPFAVICDRLGPCSPELYHCLNQVATTGIAVRNLQISCYLEDDIACVCHINAQRIDDNVSQPAILLAFRVYQDRREQDTLQEVDRLLQDVADISPDRLWETDEQHRLVWQAENSDNPSGPRPGCIGKRRDEVALTEVNTGEWREHLATLNAHKPFRDFRYCMLIDEEMHWISVSGVPVFDQQGVFRGYRGICSDITAIHEARLQTRRTTERLLYALDIFTEGFAYYDADDRLVACNQKYQHNISIGDELKPGMTFREILTIHLRRQHAFPDAMGREQEWLEERLAHFRNPRGPFDVERTGGLWMRVHEQRLPDGGLLMVITDIADQKRTEQALAESEQRFRDFARSGSDCFWETDAEFRFSWFSDPAAS